MLKLFNFSSNNVKLLNILKINKVYESKLIDNNFISDILKLKLFSREEANATISDSIRVTKRLEIVQEYFNSNKLSNIIDIVNELKLKELKIVSYDRHKQHILNLTAETIEYLKKLNLVEIHININIEDKKFNFINNLSTLSLYSCKIYECQNFNSLIELLNSSLPNLKSLCLSSIDFNDESDETETETDIYDIIFKDIYMNTLSNVNFEKYKNLCANISLKHLKQLSLHNINIPYINVENLTNLEKLNLRGNKLYHIDNLSKLTNLSILIINCNNLFNLNLKNLTNLIILNLSKNNIINLYNLNDLINLEYLDVSYNGLKKLNNGQFYDISNLKNLLKINLERNILSGIILNNLEKLNSLNLMKNNIIDLNLNNLTNLINLNLSENFLKTIDLSNLNRIQNLDLSYNLLTNLDLRNLNNLVDLNVKDNYIEEISVDHLRKINIYDSKAGDIEYINISGLKQIFDKVVDTKDKSKDPKYMNITGLVTRDETIRNQKLSQNLSQILIKFEEPNLNLMN